MRSTPTIAFFALLAVSQAFSQVDGGWRSYSNLTLGQDSKDLISFGLTQISRTNKGFNALEYSPVKLLSMESQVVAGMNTRMLVVIDNGKNSSSSKKLLKMTVYTRISGDRELTNWETLDLSLSYAPLNDTAVLNKIKTKITTILGQKDQAAYNIRKIFTTYQTQRLGTPFYYVKAFLESTRNSMEVHEFIFMKKDLQLFATAKIPVSRTSLESHPLLQFARGEKRINCANLASQLFCELAPNCVNKMLTTGVCEPRN